MFMDTASEGHSAERKAALQRRVQKMTAKILVIVPAYNEENSLPAVIRDLKVHSPGVDVLVVDDGSHDATPRVAEGMDVNVLKLPFNLGIGGAMQSGYLYADRQGYDIAVQFDGDGQHVASEIEKLLGPITSGSADIAVGSRFLMPGGYQAPLSRKIGMRIFSFLLSRILGTRVTDTTSGFRAANRRGIEYFSQHYPEDYPEVETLVLLHKKGFRIIEVPVMMCERTGGRSSITTVRSAYYMVKVLLAILVDLLKK
jgi:glycosyltransferase involved in cell wall biosynthesis